MTREPFRFLHAADLHLDRPVTGLTDCPEHLLAAVLDAPRLAAERLFRTALTEKVDFIILSGDVLSTQATGPWGPVFLLEQFERLRREGIAVYWTGGKSDEPEDWPDVLPLPENVHLFPVGEIEEVLHRRGGVPTARILGTSLGKIPTAIRPNDFPTDAEGLFSIGAVYGRPSVEALRGCGMQYWALGGGHQRETLARSPSLIHDPGVTLARCSSDAQDAGASLVEVDEFGRAEIKPIRLTPIRWESERLVFREEPDEETLAAAMRARLLERRKAQGDEIVFLTWFLDVPEQVASELRYGNLTTSLLRGVRSEFGREKPIIWSLALEPAFRETSDDERDQQTILGDYLRMTHYYKENPGEGIALSDFFPEELKEYLTTRFLLEKRKRKQPDETRRPPDGAESSESSDFSESIEPLEPARAFRPETAELVRLLSLDADELRAFRPVSDEEKGQAAYREWSGRIDRLRRQALDEAATLGTELLSEETEETQTVKRPTPKRSALLIQERREMQNYLEGKETRR